MGVLKMNKQSTKIMRRKLRSFKRRLATGEMTYAAIYNSCERYKEHMKRGNSQKVMHSTNLYFKSLFGFYPDEKGWKRHV